MEEIITLFVDMWSNFWENALPYNKLIAVASSLLGFYLVIISFKLINRLEDIKSSLLNINYFLGKISLICLVLSGFYSSITINTDNVIQLFLLVGSCSIFTQLAFITSNKISKDIKHSYIK